MLHTNPAVMALAALIPLVLGFIWYQPKVFGNTWMRAARVRDEDRKGANMILVFGLVYVFSYMIAFALNSIVIHQFGFYSMLANEPGMQDKTSAFYQQVAEFMRLHGNNFRTFKHGALHGTITGFALALPIIGIIALYERRSYKYVAVHAGFWIVSLGLMGGVICQFT